MAGGDDDIPPLEDMSEVLEHAKQMQDLKEASSSSSSSKMTSSTTAPPVANGNASSTSSTSESSSSSKSAKVINSKASTKPVKSSSSSTSSFGGMKKGFLFGAPSKKAASPGTTTASPSNPPKSTQSANPSPVGGDDIPLIRPKEDGGDNKEKYRFEEVQETLKSTAPLQKEDWVTDDLLSKLDKHPRLAKQISCPRFAQAVEKFRTDPERAMCEYKDDLEVLQFFKDFAALLGGHFSDMGEFIPPASLSSAPPPSGGIQTHDSPSGADIKVRSSTNPKQATAEDEAKMKQILSDPEIREILMDEKIMRLMEALKNNVDQGQQILQSSDPQMRAKIQKLVNAGLLGFAP